MADDVLDIVVIGGGPGGYVAAIRAAQLGLDTACVEMRGALGGTCLNVGCIPSKALLQSSEKYADARKHFADHGIKVSEVELDLKTMMARKDKVVADLTTGIEFLFKKNKVAYEKGRGKIEKAPTGDAPGEVSVDGEKILRCRNIVIATGSEVMPLPGVELDDNRIVDSTGALSLKAAPKSMIVVGAGVIGLEMGSVWSRLGAEVTVVEFLDRILPTVDGEIAKQTRRILGKQGLKFELGMKVIAARADRQGAKLTVEPATGGDARELAADIVLVSIGRRPYTDGLGLQEIGIDTDKRGFIPVDDRLRTGVEGVYAIGDCIPGPMLAHKAEEDGVAAAEIIVGQAGHVDYGKVPAVVYTHPEIASVGKTEEELKRAGIAYSVGKFPFAANSRSRATAETDGLVKILADSRTDKVLGAHIVGPLAGDLIGEVVATMEYGGSAEDIARTCHAHPQYGEAVKEAALGVAKRTIHT